MKIITTTTTVAALLVCALASPVAAQNKEHVQMEAELRMLQEQQQQLALALQQITDAIKAVNVRIDESNQTTRKGFADQNITLKGMSDDVKALRENLDAGNVTLGRLREEVGAL